MKAVIIEDEVVAAQSLGNKVTEIDPDIEIVAVLQSIEESVEWFSLNPAPDLVFMDIHLADGSGFSIFDKVRIPCPIIFTTAYDEYALRAFEVNSIDYLLKPIGRKELERALSKFNSLSPRRRNIDPDALAALIASVKEGRECYKSYFLIPYKDKLRPLAVDNIAYIYYEHKLANIHTLDRETFVLDESLDTLYSQLDPHKFFRANRQYIVAHKAIKDISFWFGSKLSVNMVVPPPEKIIVSKARVPEFKAWYTK